MIKMLIKRFFPLKRIIIIARIMLSTMILKNLQNIDTDMIEKILMIFFMLMVRLLKRIMRT